MASTDSFITFEPTLENILKLNPKYIKHHIYHILSDHFRNFTILNVIFG